MSDDDIMIGYLSKKYEWVSAQTEPEGFIKKKKKRFEITLFKKSIHWSHVRHFHHHFAT